MSKFIGKAEEREMMREESEKAVKEFLKNGGKVKKIAEGEHTEAKDMKYKFRKPAFGGKKKLNKYSHGILIKSNHWRYNNCQCSYNRPTWQSNNGSLNIRYPIK